MTTEPDDEALFLASYDPLAFPPFGVTVDVVLLTVRDDRFSVLLVERDTHPFRGRLALPGGFVQPDEDLDAAATRRLAAETGVRRDAAHVEQLGAFGRPGRDPRMRVVSVSYLVFAPDLPAPVPGRRTRSVAWVPVADVDPARLAFDHDQVLAAGVERARAKLEYSPVATAFCREEFTVAELRRVYEAVWGGPLDPRNFHRKVTGTPGFLVPVGAPAPVGPEGGRPAALFRRGSATLLHPAMLRPDHRPG
ncbi:MAG: Bifunctional adenylyltransferase/Nudix hydrolase [Frankiales bacterium]|nr:Bifunctional adenylyltransferase/Nudix hydrolase [Frankiales bacterium]